MVKMLSHSPGASDLVDGEVLTNGEPTKGGGGYVCLQDEDEDDHDEQEENIPPFIA